MMNINPKKVLIIKPSSLGDIVHSLPLLNAVHTKFTNTDIHWVVGDGFKDILEGHPMIDKLWVIKKDGWREIRNIGSTTREIRMLFKGLKAEKFDIVLDLQGLFRSGMIAKATGSPVRIGFKEAREGSPMFYTHKIEGGKNIHAVDRYLKVARHLGCDISDVSFPFPSLPEQSLLTRRFSLPDNYAVIAPGARWRIKKWPAERFGQTASRLPIKAIVIGSKGDSEIADEVVSKSGGRAVSVAGKTTMKDMAGIIKGARFMLCNDTGPMHIAAAFNLTVFALIGPTDPLKTGPYGNGNVVIRKDAPCSPCRKKSCSDPVCMTGITVDEVVEEINGFLKRG